MIVQSAAENEPHFVILMTEHMDFAGQLARAFGNGDFARPDPWDEMIYLIEHHDQGWTAWDSAPGLDPDTHLPFHLLKTPRLDVLKTGYASPKFNEARHAYCGLLSSMHIWGLYNGRYGMSDRVLINKIPDEFRERWDVMLAGQLQRQARLKTQLADDPEAAAWIEETHLFQNYKQLQFFDTLALYFNMRHPGAQTETEFLHVPFSESRDGVITVTPLGEGNYRVTPFPFAGDPLELRLKGRYLTPLGEGEGVTAAEMIAAAPPAHQTIVLVTG